MNLSSAPARSFMARKPKQPVRLLHYFAGLLLLLLLLDLLLGATGWYRPLFSGDYTTDAHGNDRYLQSSFRYRNRDLYSYSSYAFDPDVGWKFRPNQRFHITNSDLDLDYTLGTNAAGYRDVPASNTSSPVRLMLLGDGIVASTGVNDSETAANLIAERTGYDVDNWGMPGYGTDQEFTLFESSRNRSGQKPYTHVLLFFYASNDFENVLQCNDSHCCLDKPVFVPAPDPSSTGDRNQTPAEDFAEGYERPPVRYGFERMQCEPGLSSKLYDLYFHLSLNPVAVRSSLNWIQLGMVQSSGLPQKLLGALKFSSPPSATVSSGPGTDPLAFKEMGVLDAFSQDGRHRVAMVSYFLSEMNRISASEGKQFYVFIVPSRAQICDDALRERLQGRSLPVPLNASIEAVKGIGAAENISMFDTTPILQGKCHGPEAAYLEKFDHLSPAGNRMLAEAVLNAMESNQP